MISKIELKIETDEDQIKNDVFMSQRFVDFCQRVSLTPRWVHRVVIGD